MFQSFFNSFNICLVDNTFKNEIKLTNNSQIYENIIRINIPTLSIKIFYLQKIIKIFH